MRNQWPDFRIPYWAIFILFILSTHPAFAVNPFAANVRPQSTMNFNGQSLTNVAGLQASYIVNVGDSTGLTNTFSGAALQYLTNLITTVSNAVYTAGVRTNDSRVLTLTNAENVFVGIGSQLTALNASQLTSGTLPDSVLSTNVPRLNGTNVFSGTNSFIGAPLLIPQAGTAPFPAIILSNTNTASSPVQQFPGYLDFLGQAWETATLHSEPVEFRVYENVVKNGQGVNPLPSGNLTIDSQINNSGFAHPLVFGWEGSLTLNNGLTNSGPTSLGGTNGIQIPAATNGFAVLDATGKLTSTVNGGTLTNLNASALAGGTVPVAVLPVATSSALGVVKPDNTTITVTAGVLTATVGGANITNSMVAAGHGIGVTTNLVAGTNVYTVSTTIPLTNSMVTATAPLQVSTNLSGGTNVYTLSLTDGGPLTNLNATNLVGTLQSANFPSSLPAIGGSSLTSLSSSVLSGALPALNGSALTGVTDSGAARLAGSGSQNFAAQVLTVSDETDSGWANIAGVLTNGNLTASTAVYADSNKALQSSSTTSTELGYAHGVTSAIQPQLNALAPTNSPTLYTPTFVGGINGAGITNLPSVTSFAIPMGAFITNGVPDGASITAASLQTTNSGDQYVFADAVTNGINVRYAMPWDWNGGTVEVGIRALCTGTNFTAATNVTFLARAAGINNGGSESSPIWGTGMAVTNHISTGANTNNECITRALTIGNSPITSSSVLWQIQRLGSDAGDTMTNASVVITEVRIYYQRNSITNFPTSSP